MIGINAIEREFQFQSYVYVPTDADQSSIDLAIARQIKSATGALNIFKVSLNNSDSLIKIKINDLEREIMTVFDPNDQSDGGRKIQKISYRYRDNVVASSDLKDSITLEVTLLANDYTPYADELIRECTDGISADLETIWYYYRPQMSSCKEKIIREIAEIAKAQQDIKKGTKVVSSFETIRWFIPVTVSLGPEQRPNHKVYPEYDRLFGIDNSKSQLIVYAFGGVDLDAYLPDDRFAQEYFSFLRQMLKDSPKFRISYTRPDSDPLDISVDGQKIKDLTYASLFTWILDQKDYPPELGNDPDKILKLRSQVMTKFAEHWIYWEQSAKIGSVNAKGEKLTKEMTIQIRSFFGNDYLGLKAMQGAKARYAEAFSYGDIILYNGHAQFGKGAMDPLLYSSENFNDRYQLMFFNSCYSFSYYHQQFFNLKPGGKNNLDMIINGLPSKIKKSGQVTANLLNGILNLKDYESILLAMHRSSCCEFDELRVVDGELDNLFSPLITPLNIALE
ncbi:MAG: hypothetical protein KA436_00630 [Oligoflexales bacterium]|nr:hypothetical protein [Oligoflexales bacterium]